MAIYRGKLPVGTILRPGTSLYISFKSKRKQLDPVQGRMKRNRLCVLPCSPVSGYRKRATLTLPFTRAIYTPLNAEIFSNKFLDLFCSAAREGRGAIQSSDELADDVIRAN